MGKEKRKTRLEKGGSNGDFVGFSAFALPGTDSSAAQGPPPLKWSPVYTGSDSQLSLVFKKIAQKRDGLTKAKALNELGDYFKNDDISRKEQIATLSHFMFIYHSKLSYDDFASVRASSLVTLTAAYSRIPKAWTTLALDQYREIWGMVWCAQGDTSADVKVAAIEICALVKEGSFAGVLDYVRRILNYGRPKAMQDDLFARKDDVLTEMERDQLDERFERISGAAIEGMEIWIRNHSETACCVYESELTDAFLFKTLTSSKPSFRRKTYQLLATMCQHAKSFTYGQIGSTALAKILPQVVAQEKDLASIPMIIEALLFYLSGNKDDCTLLLESICKPLSKMLKKACFGASANQWGPSILPLLVTMNSERLAVALVKSLWEGRHAAIGSTDLLGIAAAVAECSSFFLLRRETDSAMGESTAKELASIWLEVLILFLDTYVVSFQARDADDHLQHGLSRDLFRLDDASYNRNNCALHQIGEWFWNEQVPVVFGNIVAPESHARFHFFVTGVIAERQKALKECKDISRLHPIVREKFHSVLKIYQATSGIVPDDKAYTFLMQCLNYCGVEYIFGVDGFTEIKKFLMNDLLRWMVIHTSSLTAGNDQSRLHLAERGAAVLAICLGVMSPHDQKSTWDATLREMAAAQCDLDILSACLVVLANDFTGLLKSGSLEEFAIPIGENISIQRRKLVDNLLLDIHVDVEPFKSAAPKTANFLQVCLGLHPTLPQVLLSKEAVARWLKVAIAAYDDPVVFDPSSTLLNPVLETMLSLATNGDMLEKVDVLAIITEAWREGYFVWKQAEKILSNDNRLCESLMSMGSLELSAGLRTLCNSSSSIRQDAVMIWSTRARRLIDVQQILGARIAPLQLVGLSDLTLWQSSIAGELDSSALFASLTNLLLLLDSDTERLSLILDADSAVPGLLVSILLAISKAEVYTRIYGSRGSDERCTYLLSILGSGKEIGFSNIESWCTQIIANLAMLVESPCLDNVAARNVSVLSELISLLFGRKKIGVDFGQVEPREVEEGQSLWYIPFPDDEHTREEVTVIKIHKDDFPRRYFTIKLKGGGDCQEKQTVPERLRTSASFLIEASISEDEQAKRCKIAAMLFKKVIKPTLTVPLHVERTAILQAAAECINIVISQCGLFGKGGLGTFKYDIFQLLTSLEEYVNLALATDDTDEICLALQVLSRCMGLGALTPTSQLIFTSTQFDPTMLVNAVLARIKNNTGPQNLDTAILEFLVVVVHGIKSLELQQDAVASALGCSSRLLCITRVENDMAKSHLSYCLITMKAQLDGIQMSLGDDHLNVETVLCTEILRSFCDEWLTDDTDLWSNCGTNHLPVWYVPFCTFVRMSVAKGKESIKQGARNNADRLCSVLNQPAKRWLAFQLLHAAAGLKRTLRDHDCLDDVSDGTLVRLNRWKEEFVVEEEADELEDDVVIVSQWLPSSLMNNIETWVETDLDFNSPNIDQLVIGRMLTWLSVLLHLETAAAVDIRNRGAFSSYVQKCNTVHSILDMLLVYLPINEKRQSRQLSVLSIEDVLLHEENVEITKLSAITLFRTVELFPTLSKRWWETDCPKSLSSALSQFVEAYIAPETLRRQLRQISAATNLGEMSVSGSIVSREVVARYTQDDSQLSVTVTLPPNFPLRNVEVDGRKTLGVPEKRWKRWALQIRLMLNSQDGTLLDAFILWKENVDKEFEGVEPCPVCYSVLSVKTYKLPNLQCNTCDHRFHSSCLFKWFESSGKSQCVLCQQPWSGTKVQ